MIRAIDLKRTALLTIDLQNDFLQVEGAYGRAGQTSEAISALPERIKPLADALRAKGGVYISAQFTLVPGPDGEPLIAPHLKELRPFLGKGDFAPGALGHSLVDELAPADFTIEKIAYSAFYQTRLEYILRYLDIDTLIVGGIVTNGGVASTVRDAHLRNVHTILLSDGCAAFKQEMHDATLVSLGSITPIKTCAEMLEKLA
ncbi:isochorismatase family protein [Roseobacter sp. HKCCD9010]|uniref:cysteine hydrolase family protein n=1 Tax=unclassified Roseobacter TaxID=196798 RepID=UPI001492663B|nr:MULTISPECIES: cysteine hydrolase [unclassified Roseobacter]MBF9052077.1 isochorismatase family protein [Rhodobacterales bacterium HKCCD4356]NNV13999.1 isochorismatase family protein [Roseobacter sp. HKCCD7357]NNV18240.1 isochorismatase family protein [Roseobacter sp. HKCCD8768]NNV27698.1 isochorismatase family protein [Roseobacter sp. HKCCD8192]NNV31941.1 isochorismatase family protein [Roseobacter sp. HKCCD9061]